MVLVLVYVVYYAYSNMHLLPASLHLLYADYL